MARYIVSFLLILAMIGGLSACSNVHYVSNNALKYVENTTAQHEDIIRQDQRKTYYGGFIWVPKKANTALTQDSKSPKKTPRLFLLKREASHYVAETLLKDNTGIQDATFEKTYFSVGTDDDNRSVGLRFRFIY